MPEWLVTIAMESRKQIPAALVFICGMWVIANKIDNLSVNVVNVMEDQKSTIREAMSVIGETREVIRNNTMIAQDSALARRELASAIDRQRDFMLSLAQEIGRKGNTQ